MAALIKIKRPLGSLSIGRIQKRFWGSKPQIDEFEKKLKEDGMKVGEFFSIMMTLYVDGKIEVTL